MPGARLSKPTASAYIDGFNLYRRLLEGRPQVKWLDVEALADLLLPEFDVVRVRYFTAIVKALPGKDVQAPQRQQVYLRALASLPRTTIQLGKFRIDTRVMPRHPVEFDVDGRPRTVRVKKTEEKGSDVALASHLLMDAFRANSDIYVVCTNDSDLTTPLRMIKEDLGKALGLLSPMEPKRASNELKQTRPDLHRRVTLDALQACQLPDVLADSHGAIRRPTKWTLNSEGPEPVGAF